jgi:hypothetical protein
LFWAPPEKPGRAGVLFLASPRARAGPGARESPGPVGAPVVKGDPRARFLCLSLSSSLFFSLSLLFEHTPALRDIHEAPLHVAVLTNPTGVRHFSPAAIVLLFRRLGLRRRPLALGLLNALRYQTNDAHSCRHLTMKKVGACLRRRHNRHGHHERPAYRRHG